MSRNWFAALAAVACATTTLSAHAQVRSNIGSQPLQETTAQLKGKSASQFGTGAGYTIVPGLIVTPSIYTEAGHDSNPDQTLREAGSGYLRQGGQLGVTKISEKTVANVTIAGSGLYLFNDDLNQGRGEGTVSVDIIHALGSGFTFSTGGLARRDEIDFVRKDIAGAFGELTFNDDQITAFLRGRFAEVDYLTNPAIPAVVPLAFRPLFEINNFDVARSEVSTGILIGNKKPVALYGEVIAAGVDYVNQRLTSVVDRDANDYAGKAGVRLTFGPQLQTDIGVRHNRRDLDNDPTIGSFNSTDFDGSLTWRPSNYFALTASYDRTIEEPSAAFSRLADVTAHKIGMRWGIFDRTNLAVHLSRDKINEIGDSQRYIRRQISSELSHDLTASVQLYTGFAYEIVNETKSDQEYDRYRIGAGLRMAFGENVQREDWSAITERLGRLHESLHLPWGAQLEVSTGYSAFMMPAMAMTTIIGGPFFDQAIGRIEDHDGKVDGVRTDVALKKFAEHTFDSGHFLSFGVSAFWAHLSGTSHSSCFFTATTDCAYININDFDPSEENNTGPFGQFQTSTRRTVDYWGVALDTHLGRSFGGGLKDEPYRQLSPFKAGVAVRGLYQDTKLHAIDVSVPDPVQYNERLDTEYYGGYLGFDKALPLRDGFELSINAEAGVYYTRTSYEGRYSSYVPVGGINFILERGSVDLDDNAAAFIGSTRLDLAKQLPWGKVGLYGQFEYLSYVPSVKYNSNDVAGGAPFGVHDCNCNCVCPRTRLDSEDAWNYTVGLSVSVPLQPREPEYAPLK